jgi:hypothetical protein
MPRAGCICSLHAALLCTGCALQERLSAVLLYIVCGTLSRGLARVLLQIMVRADCTASALCVTCVGRQIFWRFPDATSLRGPPDMLAMCSMPDLCMGRQVCWQTRVPHGCMGRQVPGDFYYARSLRGPPGMLFLACRILGACCSVAEL